MVAGQKDATKGMAFPSPEPSDSGNPFAVMVRKRTDEKHCKDMIVSINDACLLLLGYTREELNDVFQNDFYRMIHPKDRSQFIRSIDAQLLERSHFRVTYRIVAKGGRTVWLLEYGVFSRDETYCCAVMDITENMLQSAPTQKLQVRLDALLNSIPGGVLLLRVDRHKVTFQDASEGYFRLFGYTREEYLNLPRSVYGISEGVVENHRELFEVFQVYLQQDKSSFEFQIRHRDGSELLVLAQGTVISRRRGSCEVQFFISKSMLPHAELPGWQESDHRDFVVESVSQDILFDYEIHTDTLHMSEEYAHRTNLPAQIPHFSVKSMKRGMVHEKDTPAFERMLQELKESAKAPNTILRFLHKDGWYHWYHLIGAVITNETGEPVRVVGKAVNINRQKQEMLDLIDKVQRDPFTKLYNKTMTEMLVKQYLSYESSSHHALLVIDVDNFKEINDTFGHLCGDSVLIEVSNALKQKFEHANVVGRIGGDEFLVFLRGMKSKRQIQKEAEDICSFFQQVTIPSNGGYQPSASIGVAVYPEDGVNYEDLFRRADKALYASKRQGKNNVVFYADTGTSADEAFMVGSTHTLPGEFSRSSTVEREFLLDLTELLLQSNGRPENLAPALELIAGAVQADRVFLAERIEGKPGCTIRCEWHVPGVEPIDAHIHTLLYDTIDPQHPFFDENGLFFRAGTELAEESFLLKMDPYASSVLHAAFGNEQEFRGFIGCHDLSVNRIWRQKEMDALVLAAGMIDRFLLQARSQSKPSPPEK